MSDYTFTRSELFGVLQDTVEMFLEYRDRHGYTEERAAGAAVLETLEGLDAAGEVAEFEAQFWQEEEVA